MGRLGVSLALICVLALSSAAGAQQAITPAPAFTGADLAAPPTDAWITNGGDLWNQRYSPLTEINRDNVGELKAVWRASLEGSGTGPRMSNQDQVLVRDGVVYVTTGQNDVFAVDVDSGQVIWKYEADLDPARVTACCGWAVRGVGMGDGKIFVGRLDAKMVALDQTTGEVIWEIQAEDPLAGYSITSAPLYFDGMVITGFAGGDMGTRGRVKAYDADTGELVWTFYTIPGPGEFGHDTWPADNDRWMHGGAAVWQTPAVDPELGLIYFSTSNPGPDLNGNVRPGDNLFSVSILALDVHTGEYRWHFQQVHHDIWDYDSPNPVILFDAEIPGENGGEMRHGLAQAAKTGWVYLLDRETGEPLIGIEERPVMQSELQRTSPTQPFPVGDSIVPQFIDIPPQGFELVNEGRVFTPFEREVRIWKPFTAVNWPPSSYDPATGLMYICAVESIGAARGGDPDYPAEVDGVYSGSAPQLGIAAPRRGVFAALDVTTNRLAWRQAWPDTCYSGSVTTAGGLVFVGRNDGRLTALDSSNGNQLWSFQVDAGVNAPATVFEHDGQEYVVVHAGGSSLAPSKRGDGLWLFSLTGAISQLPRGAADRAGQFAVAAVVTPPEGRVPDLGHGREIYAQICVACHGATGEGGHMGGAVLTAALTPEQIMTTATNGVGDMPAFREIYSREDLHDVAGYILEELVAE